MKFITIILSIFVLKTCESTENLVTKSNLQDMALSGLYTVSIIGKTSNSDNLTIEFDEAKSKISGFSGCNRYFGSYTTSKDSITIGPIASTRKFCIGKANDIEFKFQKALGSVNKFKLQNDIIILLNNDEVLITAKRGTIQEAQHYSITYTAISRGYYKNATYKNNTITYQKNRDEKPLSIKCSNEDVKKLNGLLQKLDLSILPKLDSPTKAHQYDGAPGATLRVEHSGNSYETVTFDHGNPPKEISELVNLILALSESI